jgi:acyl-CoA synthetase (AMP-forming)/AMP-acid ligase II
MKEYVRVVNLKMLGYGELFPPKHLFESSVGCVPDSGSTFQEIQCSSQNRAKHCIRGGENIYPREIDEVLYQHPAVAAAATIGVPDPLYGEEVAAFVVLEEGSQAREEELISFCCERLADYKCPKTIRIVNEIPKGPTGKLLKRELAKQFSPS